MYLACQEDMNFAGGSGAECYGLSVCSPPPQFICWSPNSQCDHIWRWGLWDDESRVPNMRHVLIRKGALDKNWSREEEYYLTGPSNFSHRERTVQALLCIFTDNSIQANHSGEIYTCFRTTVPRRYKCHSGRETVVKWLEKFQGLIKMPQMGLLRWWEVGLDEVQGPSTQENGGQLLLSHTGSSRVSITQWGQVWCRYTFE